jgi:hypothetical protein
MGRTPKLYRSASGFVPREVLPLTGTADNACQAIVLVTAANQSAAATLGTRRRVGHWTTNDWTPNPTGEDIEALRDAGMFASPDQVYVLPRLAREGQLILRYDGDPGDSYDPEAWTAVARYAPIPDSHYRVRVELIGDRT